MTYRAILLFVIATIQGVNAEIIDGNKMLESVNKQIININTD